MPNSLVITMPTSINDDGEKIGEAFNYLFKIILETESSKTENIEWNFQNSTFLTPFFLLPLMLYKEKCNKKISCTNCSVNLESYFNIINFNVGGLNPQLLIDGFEDVIRTYKNKTYIPIINFPASPIEDDNKNKVIEIVGNILQKQLNIDGQINIALNYLLAESVNNITEHSSCDRGYIFAQYYPHKKYIDICIADNGITILGSYLKNNKFNISDDLSALQSACKGVSTKNLPNAENRGYGIITSKKMLSEGLGGIYFLFSGGAFNIKSKDEDKYIKLPDQIRWNGTIVALRIPYKDNTSFNYINYLEI
jgi:anti-sigma regulatory factor (Ser/Thr protein kinase)